MKRVENGVNAKINHICFHGDCPVFEFSKYKVHQKGENNLGPWHVYTNSSKMWLCPVLSLSQYFFFYPDVLNGDVPIFKVKQQYTQYATRLTKIVKPLYTYLKIIGFEVGDLGSHYCNKGVAVMVTAGCTVYPPIVALCIREGWFLSGVKDKYLFREKSGDQYVL